jgi:hypothetical protein
MRASSRGRRARTRSAHSCRASSPTRKPEPTWRRPPRRMLRYPTPGTPTPAATASPTRGESPLPLPPMAFHVSQASRALNPLLFGTGALRDPFHISPSLSLSLARSLPRPRPRPLLSQLPFVAFDLNASFTGGPATFTYEHDRVPVTLFLHFTPDTGLI